MHCTYMSKQTFQPFPFSVVMNIIYDMIGYLKKQHGQPTADSKNITCTRIYMDATCTHAHLDLIVYQSSVVLFPGRPIPIIQCCTENREWPGNDQHNTFT